MNQRVKEITSKIDNNYQTIDDLNVEISSLESLTERVDGEVKDTLTNVITELKETVTKLNNEAVALTKELLGILNEEPVDLRGAV